MQFDNILLAFFLSFIKHVQKIRVHLLTHILTPAHGEKTYTVLSLCKQAFHQRIRTNPLYQIRTRIHYAASKIELTTLSRSPKKMFYAKKIPFSFMGSEDRSFFLSVFQQLTLSLSLNFSCSSLDI